MNPEAYPVKEPGFILGDHYAKGDTVKLVPAQARSFIKSGHLAKPGSPALVKPAPTPAKASGKKAD